MGQGASRQTETAEPYSLPTELIQHTARFLSSPRERAVFSQTNRRIHEVLAPAADPASWIRAQIYSGHAVATYMAIVKGVKPYLPSSLWDRYLERVRVAMTPQESEALQLALNESIVKTTKHLPRLLMYGADVHAWEDTALQRAVFKGLTSAVRLLLEYGADVHSHEDLAFRVASKQGHTNIVKLLLDYGVDIHVWDDIALIHAAREGHIATVRLLLDREANVHAQNELALRLAVEDERDDVVKLLIMRGADVNAL